MNQYRCETCNHYVNITDDNGKFRYTDCDTKFGHALTTEEEDFTCRMGCASHSDFQSEREKVLDVQKKKLSDTQKVVLERLAAGERLARTRLGPWTGSFKFKGDKTGINSATIDKLRSMKLVELTTKVTMHGQAEYCHIPSIHPWTTDPSYLSYLSYQDTEDRLRKVRQKAGEP
jgi:hypothetical protein